MGGCGGRDLPPAAKYERKHSTEPEKNDKKTEYKNFDDALAQAFPGAIEYKTFHKSMSALGHKYGFTKDNTIAMYSVCRDELTQSFVEGLEEHWGNCFNISSLAGFVFCGRTGFQAGMAHAPRADGTERYLFFCGPHIAISEEGVVGDVWREGREKVSHACGALMAFQEELKEGKVAVKDDPQDLEQSSLKQYLLEYIKYGDVPSLVDLTYRAQHCIHDMVEHTLQGSVKVDGCNYLIVCGILIHGPKNTHYVWVGPLASMMKGKETDLKDAWTEVLSKHGHHHSKK